MAFPFQETENERGSKLVWEWPVLWVYITSSVDGHGQLCGCVWPALWMCVASSVDLSEKRG